MPDSPTAHRPARALARLTGRSRDGDASSATPGADGNGSDGSGGSNGSGAANGDAGTWEWEAVERLPRRDRRTSTNGATAPDVAPAPPARDAGGRRRARADRDAGRPREGRDGGRPPPGGPARGGRGGARGGGAPPPPPP